MSYQNLSPIISLQTLQFIMYCTRTREDLNIFSVSTNLCTRSFRHNASKIWNSLPNSLKVIGTLKQFRNKRGVFNTPRGVNTPNIRTTSPTSSPDDPLIPHRGRWILLMFKLILIQC